MKKLVAAFLVAGFLMLGTHSEAQLSIKVNIGQQPVWGPTGYDHVDYYYLPDVDAYYNVSTRQYVYLQNRKWVFRSTLPARYKNFDLYKGYKVVLNGDKPYLHHKDDLAKYGSFKNRHDQPVIRDSRDEKYYVNKNHPQHKQWEQDQKKKGNPRH